MDLAVQKREKFGKQVNALRRAGAIPAELYGHGIPNVHLSVAAKEFAKIFKAAGMNTVVTLVGAGTGAAAKTKTPALIYDVVRDPLTGEFDHIDFYQVKMDEKIEAKVPLTFIGEAPAVREKGAVLNKSMSEIEVEAFPQDLPHSLEVDLSILTEIDQSIYVRDIKAPKGVKVLVDEATAVATATPPAPKEEEEPAEPAVDVSAVKVETEEKKAERQAEKGDKEKE